MLYVPLGKYLTTMNSHLSAHAELFINELKGGKTVFQALVLANTQFPPRGVGSATKDGKGICGHTEMTMQQSIKSMDTKRP